MSLKKELTIKAAAEIFKLASRIGIKPRDIIGQGADVIKMGKSLFNTKVNPKLTEFISTKGKIPTKILENIKVHIRSLKNASDNQIELFKINLKEIVNAKSPKPVINIKEQVTSVKELSPFKQFEKNLEADAAGAKELAEAFKGWTPKVIKGGKDPKFNEGGIAALNAELNQLPEYYLPMAKGGISNHFRKKFNKGELVNEVNGLMEKTPFFTQEDYDKVKYKDPKGKYAVENWGKGEAPLAEATEDNGIVSYMGKFVKGEKEKNLDKAKVLAHEKLHLLWEDPEVRATAPPEVQEQFSKADKLWKKYEKSFDAGDDKKADAYYDEFDKTSSGVPLDPDNPTTGGGDVTGEELYTRFIENKYFPQKTESDEGPWGDRVHFDKTLKAQWDPYAKKFDTLMRSRQAHGGIANHFRKK